MLVFACLDSGTGRLAKKRATFWQAFCGATSTYDLSRSPAYNHLARILASRLSRGVQTQPNYNSDATTSISLAPSSIQSDLRAHDIKLCMNFFNRRD